MVEIIKATRKAGGLVETADDIESLTNSKQPAEGYLLISGDKNIFINSNVEDLTLLIEYLLQENQSLRTSISTVANAVNGLVGGGLSGLITQLVTEQTQKTTELNKIKTELK